MKTNLLKSGLIIVLSTGLFACNGDSTNTTSTTPTTTLDLTVDKELGTIQLNKEYKVVVEDQNGNSIDSVTTTFIDSPVSPPGTYENTVKVHGIDVHKLYKIKIYSGNGVVAASLFNPDNDINAANEVYINTAMFAAVIGSDVARINHDNTYASKVKMSIAFMHRTVNYDEPYHISAKIVEYGLEHGIDTNYNSFIQQLALAVSNENALLGITNPERAKKLGQSLNSIHKTQNNYSNLNNVGSISGKSIAIAGSDIATSIINCIPGGEAITGTISAIVSLFTGGDESNVTMEDLSSAIANIQSTMEDGFGNVKTGVNKIYNAIYQSSADAQYKDFDTNLANMIAEANYYSNIKNTYARESGATIDNMLESYLAKAPTDTSFNNFSSLNTLLGNMKNIDTYSLYITNKLVLNALSTALYNTAIPANNYDGEDIISRRYYYTIIRYDIGVKLSMALQTAYDIDKLALYLKYKSKYKDNFSDISFYSTVFTSDDYDTNLTKLTNTYESMVTDAVTIVSNPDLTVSPVRDIEPYNAESSILNCSYTSWTGTTLSAFCSNGTSVESNAMIESSTLTFTDTGGDTSKALCTPGTYLSGRIVNNGGHLGCGFNIESQVIFGANSNFSDFGSNAISSSSGKAVWLTPVISTGSTNEVNLKISKALTVVDYQTIEPDVTISTGESFISSLNETFAVYKLNIPSSVATDKKVAQFLLTRSEQDTRTSYLLEVYTTTNTSGTPYIYTVAYPIASKQGLSSNSGENSTYSAGDLANSLNSTRRMDIQLGSKDSGLFKPYYARIFTYRDLTGVGYDSVSLNTCDYGQTAASNSANAGEICVYVDPTFKANAGQNTSISAEAGQTYTLNSADGNNPFSGWIIFDNTPSHWSTKSGWTTSFTEADQNNRPSRVTQVKFKHNSTPSSQFYAALIFSTSINDSNSAWVYTQLTCMPGDLTCNRGENSVAFPNGIHFSLLSAGTAIVD